MDPRHKDILITKRPELVENINIRDGLFTQLIAKKILNQRMVRTIQTGRTPDQQVEDLLDILVKRGPSAFSSFCDALKEDFQEEIVELYLKPGLEDSNTKQELRGQNYAKSDQSGHTGHSVTLGGNLVRPNSSPPRLPSQPLIDQHRSSPPKLQPVSGYLINSGNVSRVPSQHHDHTDSTAFSSPSSSANMHLQHPQYPVSARQQVLLTDSHVFTVSGSRHIDPDQEKRLYDFSNQEFRGHIRNNNEKEFPENSGRYNLKHFIDDPNYQEFDGMPPRTVPVSKMPLSYRENVSQTTKEVVFINESRDLPRPNYSTQGQPPQYGFSRCDSLDAMTKRPYSQYEDGSCSPAKRQRSEDVVTIPIYEPQVRIPAEPQIIVHEDTRVTQSCAVRVFGELDDPEIDLTDGPVTVRVELCTRQFYLAHYKKSYAMRRIPRGKALIINVNEVEGKPPRRGTDIDRDNLHHLLTQLHFDVTVYNDSDGLSAKEMAIKLQDFAADPSHRQADSCFVCLLSHGEEGYIFGTDGRKLELDSVFTLFDNSSCKTLLGKPKIFVIQACRGGALDSGVSFNDGDETDGSSVSFRQLPSKSDMIICFPTQTGYYAWRNRERGSWYIEALVQVFMKYAKSEDICVMLNRVNLLVSRKVSRCPQIDMDSMSQMSEYKSTLRMPHLFFFPGIGCG